MKRFKFSSSFLILFIVLILGISAIYRLPAVQERVGWRVAELMARIKYALSPPEGVIFVPVESAILPAKIVTSTPIPANLTPGTPSDLPRSMPTPTQILTPIQKSILDFTGNKN